MSVIFITFRSSILTEMIYAQPYGRRRDNRAYSIFKGVCMKKGMKIEGWKILKGNEMQKK